MVIRLTTEQQKKRIIWSWSKYFALLLLVFLLVLTFWIFASLSSWNAENNNLQQPRTYHIVYGYDYNEIAPIDPSYPDDIEIDLTVHYPRSTLVVDDHVSIDGLAIVHTNPIGLNILSITIGFENSLTSPVIQTDGITNSSNLFLDPINGTNRFTGSMNCTWAVEGTYHALMLYVMKNATGYYRSPIKQSPNMVITVYPKAELAQIMTNNASMILAIAVYALTVVGTFSLVLSLWDRQPSSQNTQGNNKNHDNSTNTKSNVGVNIKAKSNKKHRK